MRGGQDGPADVVIRHAHHQSYMEIGMDGANVVLFLGSTVSLLSAKGAAFEASSVPSPPLSF